jgi:hypothetical protein
LNLKKFKSCFNASDKAMANFSMDLLDSPVNAREQQAGLKTVQLEIKAIYEEDPVLSQLSKEQLHLTENAKKLIFGVDRAEIPSYFLTKIRSMEDERWRVCFTQRILVFHNHVSINVKKDMGLDTVEGNDAVDGKIAANEVCFQKSYFNFIPVDFIRYMVGRTTMQLFHSL